MNPSLASYLYQEEFYKIPTDVLVVIKKNWEDYSAEEQSLLTKILNSVKIDPASVRIIAQGKVSLKSLETYAPARVLVFGSESEDLKAYETIQAQGFTVLKADDLTQLDDTKKKNLWIALKQMFGL